MGSYAQSSNTSSTSYQNLPVTQSDVSNPLNLLNASGNKLGSTELIGSSVNTNTSTNTSTNNQSWTNMNMTDLGSIGKALDLARQSIEGVTTMSVNINKSIQDANKEAIGNVIKATDSARDTVLQATSAALGKDESLNRMLSSNTLMIALAAVAGFWFFSKRGFK